MDAKFLTSDKLSPNVDYQTLWSIEQTICGNSINDLFKKDFDYQNVEGISVANVKI